MAQVWVISAPLGTRKSTSWGKLAPGPKLPWYMTRTRGSSYSGHTETFRLLMRGPPVSAMAGAALSSSRTSKVSDNATRFKADLLELDYASGRFGYRRRRPALPARHAAARPRALITDRATRPKLPQRG